MENLKHFTDYIAYYNSLTKPGYAVLVTGEWGSGKTYQIKKSLPDDQMYYISLFDITSVEEIYASVFYKMSPAKAFAKTAAGSLGESSFGTDALTFGIGGLFGKIANAVIKEDVKTDRIIVFDDLERCKVDINNILGVINKYVEHNGCKVIAIAHDIKIKDSFSDSKEKVIGQTLKIEPNITEIYNFFIQEENRNDIPKIITDIILRTFIYSECKSMRILKHTIKDCFRLYDCINTNYLSNINAMDEVFTFYAALSIEYRFGGIKDEDLAGRHSAAIMHYVSGKDTDKPAIIKLNERYRKNHLHIDFSRNTLSDETLINCLTRGYYNNKSINDDISNNRYLESRESESWLRLMNFDQKSPQEIQDAIDDVNNELASFSITDTGIILHIFHLKLLMSLIEAHTFSYDEIYNQFKTYLRQLLDKNILPPREMHGRFSSFDDTSHGYTYWIRDEYITLSRKMISLVSHFRNLALQKQYPQFLKEIIDSLESTPCNFPQLVAPSFNDNGKYAYVDVLRHIRPITFVEKWLNSPNANLKKISQGLNERYTSGALLNHLSEEAKWVKQVNQILAHKASLSSGFEALRLERLKIR